MSPLTSIFKINKLVDICLPAQRDMHGEVAQVRQRYAINCAVQTHPHKEEESKLRILLHIDSKPACPPNSTLIHSMASLLE